MGSGATLTPVGAAASGGHPLQYPGVPLRNEAGPRYVLRDHRQTLSRQRVFGARGLRDILRDGRRNLNAPFGPVAAGGTSRPRLTDLRDLRADRR